MRFLFVFLFSVNAFAFEFINKGVVSFERKGTGGISGIHFNKNDGFLYAISDDRGHPRIFKFKIELEPTPTVIFIDEIKIKLKKSNDSIDAEGISFLPWGNFLISTEGDANKKPRIAPKLLDIKADGAYLRDYDFPKEYNPDRTGKQVSGVRNNYGFEGLSKHPTQDLWLAGLESQLMQDPPGIVRLVQYSMPEAWVIKPLSAFAYPLAADSKDIRHGLSDLLWLTDKKLLVLERGALVSVKGLEFKNELYFYDLTNAENILDKQKLEPTVKMGVKNKATDITGTKQNLEGITLGPRFKDGSESLILVSDDNFNKMLKTEFIFYSYRADK